MIVRFEIGFAAFCLAIGTAGQPLEPLRILAALAVCVVASLGGRFIAAASLVAVVLSGWLQHQQFRLTTLAAAAVLGIAVRFFGESRRAGVVMAAAAAAAGTAFLVLG